MIQADTKTEELLDANFAKKIRKTNVPTPVPQAKNERIALPTKEGYSMIQTEEIIRFGIDKTNIFCILKNNVKHEVHSSLKQIENSLETFGFLRVHHAHLINFSHIQKYIREKAGKGKIVMSNGDILDVSIRRRSDFINYFKHNSDNLTA